MKINLIFDATLFQVGLCEALANNGFQPTIVNSESELNGFDAVAVCDWPKLKKLIDLGNRELIQTILITTEDRLRDNINFLPTKIGGIVSAKNPLHVLVDAIHTVKEKNQFVDPAFEELVSDRSRSNQIMLTSRQIQIIRMVADGKSSREIADELQLSHRTIENHRARAMERLSVNSAAEMIDVSRRFGWI